MKKLRVIIDDNLKIDEEKRAVETIKVEINGKIENFKLKTNAIKFNETENEFNLFSIYENTKRERVSLPFDFFVENIKNYGEENWKIIKWLFKIADNKKTKTVLETIDAANKMGLRLNPETLIEFLNKLNLWEKGEKFEGYKNLPLKVYINDDEGAIFLKGDEFHYENWVYNVAYIRIINDEGGVRFIVSEREN